MLVLVFSCLFVLDILLAVASARSEPGTRLRTAVMVFFGLQVVLGVGGGAVAVFRSLVLQS